MLYENIEGYPCQGVGEQKSLHVMISFSKTFFFIGWVVEINKNVLFYLFWFWFKYIKK